MNKLRRFVSEASDLVGRYYSKSEVRVYSTVSIADMHKKLDHLSKDLRLIDERIQEINWTTELI